MPSKPLLFFAADVAIWQREGACREVDPDLFFAEGVRGAMRAHLVTQAKKICATCPVIAACREYGVKTQEPYGIWGGLTQPERQTALRGHRWHTPHPQNRRPASDSRARE